MAEKTEREMNPMELSELFGAPLVATVDAGAQAARRFARFIEDYGFEKTENAQGDGARGSLGALRRVSFTVPGQNAAGSSTVSVPALALVPLPAIEIESAEFAFGVRVLGSAATPRAMVHPPLDGTAPATSPPAPRRLHAALAQETTPDARGKRSPLSANMFVRLHVKQSDMPAGVSTLMNVMSGATSIER